MVVEKFYFFNFQLLIKGDSSFLAYSVTMKRQFEKYRLSEVLKNPELVKPLIAKRCVSISQMTVKAFHLCDAILARDESTWPDFSKGSTFTQLFTQGCETTTTTNTQHPAIEKAWRDYFEPIGYPPAEMYPFDNHLVTYNAKIYRKNFLNILKRRFTYRQRKAVYAYLDGKRRGEERGDKKDEVDALLRLINGKGRNSDKVFSEKHYEFIDDHKKYLTKNFRKFRFVDYLRYYKFLSEKYPSIPSLEMWRLFPNDVTRRRCVAFDPLCLYNLLKHANKIDCGAKALFKVDIIERNGWIFDEYVLTDGQHCYAQCSRYGEDINFEDGREKKIKRKKPLKVKVAGSNIEDRLFQTRDRLGMRKSLKLYVKNYNLLWSRNTYRRYGARNFQKKCIKQFFFVK